MKIVWGFFFFFFCHKEEGAWLGKEQQRGNTFTERLRREAAPQASLPATAQADEGNKKL